MESLKPKNETEYYRKKNFSNIKEGDIIYLEKNHKLEEGNYIVESISQQNKGGYVTMINIKGEKGEKYSFVKDYLFGLDPFGNFKIMDLNYSLQK